MNIAEKPATFISPELIARFVKIVGEKNAIPAKDKDAQQPYLTENRKVYVGHSPVVLRPGSTAEVAAILKLANETGTPIVPQGGNTGLVGGQTPMNGEIVLSLNRMDKIREIDATSNTLTAEAGVTLGRAREAAASVDRLYPLLLPSEGSCTVGGNLSTNAGGTQALSYGIARNQALGLEVVLPDGRIMNNLNKLKKDNTGYDLRDLFIGAEGTLGVITAAVLRMIPRPRSVETAFIGLPSPEAALKLLGVAAARSGGLVTSFEIMGRSGLENVLRHMIGCRDPLAEPHPWYILIELSSASETGLRDILEDVLAGGLEQELITDATIADSLEQGRAFWRIRELFGDGQRLEGASISHDVSVPVASVPTFLAEAGPAVHAVVAGCRPAPFGHLGDGNIHYSVIQPPGADKEAYLQRWHEISDAVFAVVLKLNGSISAEHGIGVMKRDALPKVKDPVALDLMRMLKRTIDPKGILNPGKVL